MVEIEPQCPEIVILSEKAWRTRRTRMRLGRKEQGETHEDGMEIVLRHNHQKTPPGMLNLLLIGKMGKE